MATLNFQPSVVRASATDSANSSSVESRRKPSSATCPSWLAPLLYRPAEADNVAAGSPPEKLEAKEKAPMAARFAPGCFTPEKAKRLRMLTTNTDTFHDVMYHSAIAARLASDFDDRFSKSEENL